MLRSLDIRLTLAHWARVEAACGAELSADARMIADAALSSFAMEATRRPATSKAEISAAAAKVEKAMAAFVAALDKIEDSDGNAFLRVLVDRERYADALSSRQVWVLGNDVVPGTAADLRGRVRARLGEVGELTSPHTPDAPSFASAHLAKDDLIIGLARAWAANGGRVGGSNQSRTSPFIRFVEATTAEAAKLEGWPRDERGAVEKVTAVYSALQRIRASRPGALRWDTVPKADSK